VRQYLAIALDDIVISCPVIREPIIGGKGVIEGKFTIDEATDLVVKLNSGRLPVTFNVIENRTVGPSLGIKSISDSKKAAVAGAILVLLFMFLYYRLPGIMADIALLYYVVIFFGALSLLNATLTLPGIAGFVMSVGMAVDANVIIFERLKEELRSGKTFRSALDAAFRRAWTAIFDSNITTIMAGVVLYNLGTGAVRGFAVTLVLGVTVSMYSAIIVTRLLLEWVVGGKGMQEYWLYGVTIPKGSAISKGGEV
jgi:protein-export membrane protein SecD